MNGKMSIAIDLKKIKYLFWIIVYRLVVDSTFCLCIAKEYGYYMGLIYSPNITKVIISYVLLIISAVVTCFDYDRLSSVVLMVEMTIMYVPMLTLFAFSDRSTFFMIISTVAYIIQTLIVRLSYKVNRKKIYFWLQKSQWVLVIIVIMIAGTSCVYTLVKFGIPSLAALNPENVYDIRDGVNYSFPFSYIVPWSFKVVFLFLLVIGLYIKKLWLVIVSLVGQGYLFLVYANKSTFFSIILVLAVYIVISEKCDVIKTIVIGLSGLGIVSLIAYVVFDNIMLISYGIRRTLLVPATIKFAYYDFFSENKLLHFADNSIGHVLGIKSPYKLEAPKLIAEYLSVPDSHCNTGLWGDAYANFGVAGVLLFSLFFILLMLLMEEMTNDIPANIVFPIAVMLVYNLNDAAMFTWLLGGGAGLLFIELWLFRNSYKDLMNDKEIQKNSI